MRHIRFHLRYIRIHLRNMRFHLARLHTPNVGPVQGVDPVKVGERAKAEVLKKASYDALMATPRSAGVSPSTRRAKTPAWSIEKPHAMSVLRGFKAYNA